MAFEGMDADQVEQYGHQLLAESNNVESLIHSITSQVSTLVVSWLGPDSDQFHQEWSNSYLRQMQGAQKALHDLGSAALSNAHEQRAISGHL